MSIDGEAWALTYSFLEIEAMMQVPTNHVPASSTDFRSLSFPRVVAVIVIFRSLLRAKIIDLWWESEDVIFLVTITTRNYVIRTINNSCDLNIRNGFLKLFRYNVCDATCGRN